MLQQVELASTFFNKFFQLATTKSCCVTMFEVGGNTCNNAYVQQRNNVALQVEEKCCPYYRAFMYVCAQYYHLLTVAIVILTYPLYIYSIV